MPENTLATVRGCRRGFANAALACFAGFALGLALLHLLRPDLHASSHMISDYGVGPWGGVMSFAFASAGLGCLLLALAWTGTGPGTLGGRLVAVLLSVAAVGLAVSAACPTDLAGAPATPTGAIHEFSFMVNVGSLVLAAILLALEARRQVRLRALRIVAPVLALLMVAALVAQFRTLHRGMPYGLVNRMFVGLLITWLVVTALHLRSRQPSMSGPGTALRS